MADENRTESDEPHQARQRRQRRIENQRRAKRPRDEAESKDTPRCSFPTGEEETPTASLETEEQGAAASREPEWEEPQNELHEDRRADRARRTSGPRRLDGDSGLGQDDTVPDSPLKNSPPRVSDSDSVSPGGPGQQASLAEGDPQSAEPEEVNNPHGNDETNTTDIPDATLQGTRWISQQDLEKLLPQGVKLFQSEATDAIYHLDHRGETVWVVDKNGDCVIAQTKKAGSTPESSPEEADP